MITFPSTMHAHTHYGDGKNSPEEMVLAAIDLGFVSIGIAEHAWAPYDLDVCIPKSRMRGYQSDIAHLKEKYADKIEVSCGLEIDYYYLYEKANWDHVVGSVHYVQSGNSGKYYTIDWRPDIFEDGIDDAGNGNVRTFIEMYGENVFALAKHYKPHVMGHLNVIEKLNSSSRFFDPGAGWYQTMWEKIISEIAANGLVTEVNTGGMSRGYVDHPYPSSEILHMLHRAGGQVTICSDAHEAGMLDYGFDVALDVIREVGYKSVKLWQGGRFVDFSV
ncbi:MAG: histidinol-phosphatase [Oscillospiraceae bacterium]|nr:histidinol-phosphatase [Oscillospiraceae bacterium]